MRKFFVFCFSAILFFLTFSVVSAQGVNNNESVLAKQAEVNSFELFWPIVAGKTMGDSYYSLKLFKEKVREAFIFSSFKKADYRITISEKRLVEAESLFKRGDYLNAGKTMDLAIASWEKVKSLIDQSDSSGISTVDLKLKFKTSLEKQSLVLGSLLSAVPETEKAVLQQGIDKIKEISKI